MLKITHSPDDRLFLYVKGMPEEIDAVRQSLTFVDQKLWKEYQRALEAGQPMEPPTPVCFFDDDRSRFLLGHWPIVRDDAVQQYIPMEVYLPKDAATVPEVLPLEGITYRDYQLEAIQIALAKRYGIIKQATAAGKTIVAAGILTSANRPSLYLVTQVPLLHQGLASFQRFGVPDLGIVGDGNRRIDRNTVADARYLAQLIKRGDTEIVNWLSGVEVLIVDECHRAPAAGWTTVVLSCPASRIRIGLSGTPFESRDRESLRDIQLIGMFGNSEGDALIYETPARELMESGFIAKPKIYMVPIHAPKVNRPAIKTRWARGRQYHKIYDEGIVSHSTRNTRATQIIYTLVRKAGLQTLVLVQQIDHGRKILESLTSMGISAVFVAGNKQVFYAGQEEAETDIITNFRSETVSRFARREFEVLIGSPVFSEGYDLPNGMVEAAVLLSGGKGLIPVLQRLGRALRPKPDNNEVVIIDFFDSQHFYLEAHSKRRSNEYQAEGYEVYGWGHFIRDFLSTSPVSLTPTTQGG